METMTGSSDGMGTRTLSLDEQLFLLDAALATPPHERARNVCIMQLLVHTPLAAAELAALDVSEVDVEQHELWIAGHAEALGVSDLVAEALEAHLAERGDGRAEEQALFLSRRGTRMSAAAIEAVAIRLGFMFHGAST